MSTPLIKLISKTLPKAFAAAGNANPSESATLIRSTPGARTPGALADGTNPTTTLYACKGFVSTDKHEAIDGTLVESTDRVIGLLGGTLAIRPKKGDRITIDSRTDTIESLEGTDALWLCLGRS
jgi:hypothetical protein